jgi:hypothetical protein
MEDADWRVWLVEKADADGSMRPLARLEDARWADMFWVVYSVVDLTTCEEDRARLFSTELWHADPLPTFRHVPTNVVWEHAFAGGQLPSIERPYVTLRALHPPMRPAPGMLARSMRWLRARVDR